MYGYTLSLPLWVYQVVWCGIATMANTPKIVASPILLIRGTYAHAFP